MKKLYWFLLCFLSFNFIGCDGEDDQLVMPVPTPNPNPNPNPNPTYDGASPQIAIFSPLQDDSYLSVGVVIIYAEITDDVGLNKVELFLVDPSGERRQLNIKDTGVQENSKKKTITQVLIHDRAVSGNYGILIEAKDKAGKASSKSVNIRVIAEALSKLDFKTAFMSTGWFESMGCCSSGWDVGTFNYAFYSILNKNQWDYSIDTTLVNEFGLDFGGHSQLWARWDTNKNNYLENSELEKGLEELKFFKQWDKNGDNRISEEELADGIGILWDVNKDNVVTAAEFERKLLKYFLS
jgi:hypothetical protein